MNDKFPNLFTAFIAKRTHVMKTITMLAGPFNDSNTNRVYHKNSEWNVHMKGRGAV